VNRITAGTQSLVTRLQIKAAIEIKRWAILVELGTHSCAVGENEINVFGPRKEGSAD
jgi:hypothetical protein